MTFEVTGLNWSWLAIQWAVGERKSLHTYYNLDSGTVTKEPSEKTAHPITLHYHRPDAEHAVLEAKAPNSGIIRLRKIDHTKLPLQQGFHWFPSRSGNP